MKVIWLPEMQDQDILTANEKLNPCKCGGKQSIQRLYYSISIKELIAQCNGCDVVEVRDETTLDSSQLKEFVSHLNTR